MTRLLVCFFMALAAGRAAAESPWPQFRGPDGQGHAAERGLPTKWGENDNIAWKTPIAGRGWSSPVIANGQIWLTTALDNGHSLHAVCLDLDGGKISHDLEVFHVDAPDGVHSKNSFASPTPLLEEDADAVHA